MCVTRTTIADKLAGKCGRNPPTRQNVWKKYRHIYRKVIVDLILYLNNHDDWSRRMLQKIFKTSCTFFRNTLLSSTGVNRWTDAMTMFPLSENSWTIRPWPICPDHWVGPDPEPHTGTWTASSICAASGLYSSDQIYLNMSPPPPPK